MSKLWYSACRAQRTRRGGILRVVPVATLEAGRQPPRDLQSEQDLVDYVAALSMTQEQPHNHSNARRRADGRAQVLDTALRRRTQCKPWPPSLAMGPDFLLADTLILGIKTASHCDPPRC